MTSSKGYGLSKGSREQQQISRCWICMWCVSRCERRCHCYSCVELQRISSRLLSRFPRKCWWSNNCRGREYTKLQYKLLYVGVKLGLSLYENGTGWRCCTMRSSIIFLPVTPRSWRSQSQLYLVVFHCMLYCASFGSYQTPSPGIVTYLQKEWMLDDSFW